MIAIIAGIGRRLVGLNKNMQATRRRVAFFVVLSGVKATFRNVAFFLK